MKRGMQHNAIHRFSFGERFDEKMLRMHFFGSQRIILSIHQFIGFSPLNKSAGMKLYHIREAFLQLYIFFIPCIITVDVALPHGIDE